MQAVQCRSTAEYGWHEVRITRTVCGIGELITMYYVIYTLRGQNLGSFRVYSYKILPPPTCRPCRQALGMTLMIAYRRSFIHNGPRMGSHVPPPPPCPASRRLSCRDLNSRRTYSDVCGCGLVLTHKHAEEAAETIRTDVSERYRSLTVL